MIITTIPNKPRSRLTMQFRTLLWLAAVVGVSGKVHAPTIAVADEPPRASIWRVRIDVWPRFLKKVLA